MAKPPSHSRDTVTGIYEHPPVTKSDPKAQEAVPKSMLDLREKLRQNNRAAQTKNPKHIPGFAESNLNGSSLRAKSDFDGIIKEWITTNWLDTRPVIQQKPCHILIHDKLLFENLNLFETIHHLVTKYVPEINVPLETVRGSWNKELTKLMLGKTEKLSKLQTERNLKEMVKNVYSPYVEDSKVGAQRLGHYLKDSLFIRKIISTLNINVKYETDTFGKLKNIENLNERNDITIIKDNELSLIPSLDYMNLLKKINHVENPLRQLNILKYKSVLGNKTSDFQNLQILKNILLADKLHHNEKFMIITGERATSLEYFRLLKLFNKTYRELKLKGCVVYLNSEQAQKDEQIIGKPSYNGKELYYVVENFSDIYELIEVL